MEYTLLIYWTHDDENPDLTRYVGDENGAIAYAMEEGAFEVDIYEGDRIHPDARSVCAVMYDGQVIYD